MFAWIDGLWWLDVVSALALGIWSGRRWERVRQEARCDARMCDQINDLRIALMDANIEKRKLEAANEAIRRERDKSQETVHSLRTSNGMLKREIEKLTYQLPRPVRRMMA